MSSTVSKSAAWLLGLLSALSSPAQGDGSDRLETIVVTGSRMSYRDLLDTPAVAITRPGDYLLLPFTLVNDTRSAQGRKDEIYATIRKMTARSGGKFELVHGETFVTRVDGGNLHLPLESDEKRPDTSHLSLFVRIAIKGAADRAEDMTRELREFVAQSERVGRTEIDVANETALSLTRPERFHQELIQAIAEDTSLVRRTLGAQCEVAIDGLGSRIEWQRVSASELMLYIPYSLQISGCGAAAPAAAASN